MFNNGAMLTGDEIRKQIKKGNIAIDPFDECCLNPNSYNLRLHPQLLVYENGIDKDGLDIYSNINDSCSISQDNGNRLDEAPEDSSIAYVAVKSDICDVYKTIERINGEYKNPLDMKIENPTRELRIPKAGYVLKPGVLYIGRTRERTWTDKYIPMINGRSSGGRLGISIHVCAGFGDIGFDGTWTLEITCVEPVKIYPDVQIAQICYFKPCGKVKDLYRGRYFKQKDATASRFYK